MKKITKNEEQKLFLIPEAKNGFSCLGFQVVLDRIARLSAEFGVKPKKHRAGSFASLRALNGLLTKARRLHKQTGFRSDSELSLQLMGLEGKRVEVVTEYNETRRFWVGRSGGWAPCHLEIARRNCYGGPAAEKTYKSVCVVSTP